MDRDTLIQRVRSIVKQLIAVVASGMIGIFVLSLALDSYQGRDNIAALLAVLLLGAAGYGTARLIAGVDESDSRRNIAVGAATLLLVVVAAAGVLVSGVPGSMLVEDDSPEEDWDSEAVDPPSVYIGARYTVEKQHCTDGNCTFTVSAYDWDTLGALRVTHTATEESWYLTPANSSVTFTAPMLNGYGPNSTAETAVVVEAPIYDNWGAMHRSAYPVISTFPKSDQIDIMPTEIGPSEYNESTADTPWGN